MNILFSVLGGIVFFCLLVQVEKRWPKLAKILYILLWSLTTLVAVLFILARIFDGIALGPFGWYVISAQILLILMWSVNNRTLSWFSRRILHWDEPQEDESKEGKGRHTR